MMVNLLDNAAPKVKKSWLSFLGRIGAHGAAGAAGGPLANIALEAGRAGAGTIAELALLGKPAILIPLPGSGGGEQQLNARVLGQIGAAVVLDQSDATPERLLEEVTRLVQTPELLEAMGKRAASAAAPEAAERLTDLILKIAAESRRLRG